MKLNQRSIVMFGHDETLLATRQWVLQSRGYRVVTATDLGGIAAIPQDPPIRLVLLCHTLSAEECEAAMVLAQTRWPEIQSLWLDPETKRVPSGLLGQLLHTMDGPGKLVAMVGRMIGAASQTQMPSRP